jgi:hypothetical protein
MVDDLAGLVGNDNNGFSSSNGNVLNQIKAGLNSKLAKSQNGSNGYRHSNGHNGDRSNGKARSQSEDKKLNGHSKEVKAHEFIPFDEDEDFSGF